MTFLETLRELLGYPLFTISGTPVTPGTLVTCVLILLLAVLLARWAGRGVVRALTVRGQPEGTAIALAKILRYILILVGLFVAIDTVGININALLAGSAALFVGIGLGLQSVTSNFFSGLVLLLERPVKCGDFIQVGDTFGTVDNIGLRATRVTTRDEVTILVPNSELANSQVVNQSIPTEKLRIRIDVGVAYGSDTRLVESLLLEAARAESRVLANPEPEVWFKDFGDSSLDFTLLAWIEDPRDDNRISSRLRFAIDESFRARGITIPFPQRDLHLRSGLDRLAG